MFHSTFTRPHRDPGVPLIAAIPFPTRDLSDSPGYPWTAHRYLKCRPQFCWVLKVLNRLLCPLYTHYMPMIGPLGESVSGVAQWPAISDLGRPRPVIECRPVAVDEGISPVVEHFTMTSAGFKQQKWQWKHHENWDFRNRNRTSVTSDGTEHPAKQAKNGLTIWSEPVGIAIEPGKTKNLFSNNSELWLSVIYPSKLEFSQYKCGSNH